MEVSAAALAVEAEDIAPAILDSAFRKPSQFRNFCSKLLVFLS
jgi:hypothetical protein